MERKPALPLAALVLGLGLVSAPLMADEAFVSGFQDHLAKADLDGAEALAQARADADPADAEARFALGTAQFLQAVEGLGQGLYDHGLTQGPDNQFGIPSVTSLPFLRMPVTPNLDPQPFGPEVLRQILTDFDTALLRAEATLAGVPKGPVALHLDVTQISLDYNRNGKAGANESLPALIEAISGVQMQPGFPRIGFDESDVTWLRGYSHLLAGISEILLAHDWSETVNLTFQGAFPKAGLPSAPLDAGRGALMAELEANQAPGGGCWDDRFAHYDEQTSPEEEADRLREARCWSAMNALEYGGIGDLVAFVHLFRWPVVEPERLLSARQHLLTMLALSRESWASILAETDDDAEWVPGPKQTSLFGRMRVDDRILAGWMTFLDQAEGVLEGRLLLPHWRFDKSQGLNLRRMFEEPRTLDPVLILAGPGAIPYMQPGQLAEGSTFDTGMQVLEGGLLAYFLWFN